MFGAQFKLATYVGKMGIERTRGGGYFTIPDAVAEHIAGKKAPWVAKQQQGQFIFFGGQVCFYAVQDNAFVCRVDIVGPTTEGRFAMRLAIMTPQQRLGDRKRVV